MFVKQGENLCLISMKQNSKICCKFFLTGLHSSERRQYSERCGQADLGYQVGGGVISYLIHCKNINFCH